MKHNFEAYGNYEKWQYYSQPSQINIIIKNIICNWSETEQ